MGIVHRVLQQDYPKLQLLLETFRSVKPHAKWEIVGTQKWLHRPKEMIQISAWYFVVCWKSGGNQLTCAKCKPRAKPRSPLWSFTSGNPMQRIHIDIVARLPRSRRGNRYRETVSWKQCVFPVLPSQQSFWTFKAENHDLEGFVGVTSNSRRPSMTEVKSALLVPLFLSFSFSHVQASSFIAPTICFALLRKYVLLFWASLSYIS